MNLHKMKLLHEAINSTPPEVWETYKRLNLVRRGKPCPALCAYAARLDLQSDYKLTHDAMNGVIWRDDGSVNWQLAKYFGLDDSLADRIFSSGATVTLATHPSEAAAFVLGIIKGHEQALEEAMRRVEASTEALDTRPLSELGSDEPFEIEHSDDFTDSLPHALPVDEGPDLTPTPLHVSPAKFDKYSKGGK